ETLLMEASRTAAPLEAVPTAAPAATLTPVTVARGDGIGPEIMDATLRVLQAAGARIAPEFIDIGEQLYKGGHTAGIGAESWESLRRTRVFLKAPITTPQGGGVKSLNVTIRKSLGLYANVRPCTSYAPYVPTRHPEMDVVIIRENEEDLYAGIEHQQTDEVMQCLKLISVPGTEKIIRYAFEYARRNGRRKVACFTKDNIMKLTDGLFHRIFNEVAADYPEIENEHWIVDIGAARLADTPEMFDVIVMPNLYGDILSDVAAQISGSVGIAGSANIGDGVAMFEAIHGSAPKLAGQDKANPSGLLLGAVMMLVHIGQADVAERIHNAWLRTLEDGVHTPDVAGENTRALVGTQEFADAVADRLGKEPQMLKPVRYTQAEPLRIELKPRAPRSKELVGVDVFVHWRGDADALAARLNECCDDALQLSMITNRGVKVWPNGMPETFCTDHWRCRFSDVLLRRPATHARVVSLLERVERAGLDFIKTENLYNFDGQPGYSLGQGQ
ncbi:MAG TPA: NADP-dependent isocitrate dehydrogenase, partial [Longimicrobium sp.]